MLSDDLAPDPQAQIKKRLTSQLSTQAMSVPGAPSPSSDVISGQAPSPVSPGTQSGGFMAPAPPPIAPGPQSGPFNGPSLSPGTPSGPFFGPGSVVVPPGAPPTQMPAPPPGSPISAMPTVDQKPTTAGATADALKTDEGPTPSGSPYQPSVGQPKASTPADASGRATAIAQMYKTALGRDASPDEIASWANGGMDMTAIQQAIYDSPEAKTYGAAQTAKGNAAAAPAQGDLYSGDRNTVLQAIRSFYQQKGVTAPDSDINYWADHIMGATDKADMIRRLSEQNELLGTSKAPGAAGGAATPSTVSDYTKQLREILAKRIADASSPVDENSAEVAIPFQAAQLQAGRGVENDRAIAAEQAYAAAARGGGSVNQDTVSRSAQQGAERMATGLANTKAQLITRVYQAKAQELQSDLQMAMASGDAESARNIQVALANLQAALTREGYGINLAEFTQGQNNTTVTAGAGG